MAATRTNVAVIPINGTTSQSIDLSKFKAGSGLVAFIMPAAFTGASLSWNVSRDDVTYQSLRDSSNVAVSVSVSASKAYGFTQDVRSCLEPWRFIQFVSASAEGASRSITLLVE